MKKSKRFSDASEHVETLRHYALDEAVSLVKKSATAKFNETIELKMNLGVDPRHADQIVRGTISLPHGTGKEVKVLAICKGDNQQIAKDAGADFVGFENMVEKIISGWTDVDVVITTPDCMSEVGKLGRILGPRGLMPNPKSGTVTQDVGKAVGELKAGRIEFRTDKYGIIHSVVGKASFEENQLSENLKTLIGKIVKLRPSTAKGRYIKSIDICSTMGPRVSIDLSSALK